VENPLSVELRCYIDAVSIVEITEFLSTFPPARSLSLSLSLSLETRETARNSDAFSL
jgi:hypothetical protein